MTIHSLPSPAPVPAYGRVRKILLATDLSAASEAATTTAMDLAAGLKAELLAVSVIDPGTLRLPGGHFGSRVDQVRSVRETAAQTLVARGRSAGVDVSFLIWEGEPAESIVEAALAEGADLIVVGSHGRGMVGRFLIGSVSDQVVRNAAVPVLVVRGRERLAEGSGAPRSIS
ncbi:MAG TPA: universal stress protein [Candidatus Limnocylindrales bacterium]|jgi:nucleotide-binding universal stress UspA family protein